jgi:UDP-4-amino-4,6-dideoxy-N-acetyl-beta-L-altrosamine transaminase
VTTEPFLPYCRHVVEDDDIAAVTAVLKSDALTQGPAVAKFESDLIKVTGAAHAVVCSSGTAALHLAALALDLKPGDTVLVPAQTFAATANCIRYVGADVIFTDVCPQTGLMRPEDLEAAMSAHRGRRFRAVFPVHINGQAADMAGIAAIAKRASLSIVEDACHALGTVINGDGPVGNCRHSQMTVFSFHPAKTIAMGEGGAITTNDPALNNRLARFRTHGITRNPQEFVARSEAFDAMGEPNPWYYEMQDLGFNYRACDMQCALGSSQLAKLSRFAAARRKIVAAYETALTPLAPKICPVERRTGQFTVWHLAAVLIDFAGLGKDRATVMRQLREMGIGTQVNYIPVHKLPYYTTLTSGHPVSLPGAESYYAKCLSLPLFATMTEADVTRVVAALKTVLDL